MIAIAAWFDGLWRVCCSLWLVAIAYVVLLAITLPLGAILHRQLPPSPLAPAIESDAGPVPDFDWLDEVTAHRRGLLGTLSPAVIGVAAPFDNLDRFTSNRGIPAFAIVLSGGLLMAWAWLWGGVISRLAGTRRRFFRACSELFMPVLTLNIAGLVSALLSYLVLRFLLFDALWPRLSAGIAESTAFISRAVLTALLIAIVAAITLVFDYARIALVVDGPMLLPDAIRAGLVTIRSKAMAVTALVVMSGLLLAGLLAVYGAFEFIPGGSVPTLNRIIFLGQAYIVARIGLRLWNAAAQVALHQRVTDAAPK